MLKIFDETEIIFSLKYIQISKYEQYIYKNTCVNLQKLLPFVYKFHEKFLSDYM
jgi:hypothetical protein